jgi:ABC-2 type transport system permease protein
MRKIFTIAWSEFLTAIHSKAFLIGIAAPPLLILGSVGIQKIAGDRADREPKKVAVIDETGRLYPMLSQAAGLWNEKQITDGGATIKGPRFLLEAAPLEGRTLEQVQLSLSDRVRGDELFAFVHLPPGLFSGKPVIRYFTSHPTHEVLPHWLEEVVGRLVIAGKLQSPHVDPQTIVTLMQKTEVTSLGLLERNGHGRVLEAQEVDFVRSFITPLVLALFMFTLVISSSSPLLNSVMEEKMTRISEVLLGSVAPFQLMMGKLLGILAVSLVLALVYLAAAFVLAVHNGYADAVGAMQVVWFVVYLVMAMLIYGSLFIAIGASATDLKDAQGMITPVMMLFMLPMFLWLPVLRAPESPLAVVASLVPFATPVLMTLRLALTPGPAAWQIALSLVLTALTSVGFVWAAGRVVRVGILMQGKSAGFGEMMRWIRAS